MSFYPHVPSPSTVPSGRDLETGHGNDKNSNVDRDSVMNMNHSKRYDGSFGRSLPRSSIRVWWLEIICVIGSALCLAANDRPLPSLAMGINLNTIVAVLSGAAKGLLMTPVTEALGQCKWNWFVTRPRSVAWLPWFDSASRSVVSSINLICQIGIGHMATLGAIIYTASVMISLTTQEIVFYKSESRTSGTAAYLRDPTEWDKPSLTGPGPGGAQLSEIDEAFKRGLRYHFELYSRLHDDKINCTSADCNFPSFESISLCFESQNVPGGDLDVRHFEPWRWQESTLSQGALNMADVPSPVNGLNISVPSADLSIVIPTPFRQFQYLVPVNRTPAVQKDQQAYRSGIMGFVFVEAYASNLSSYNPLDHSYNVSVFQVLMFACINTYHLSIMPGSSNLELLSSDFGLRPETVNPRTGPLLQSNGTVHTLHGRTTELIANSFSQYLDIWGYGAMNRPYEGSMLASQFMARASSQSFEGDILDLFSTAIKSLNMVLIGLPRTGHDNVQGTSLAVVTVVAVRWAWLSFLAAEIVLTGVFLGWTIIATSKAGTKVWKTSTMATMLTLDERSRNSIVKYMGGGNDKNSGTPRGHIYLRLVDDQLVYAGNKEASRE
ncbi:hypothetical protein QBC37DRAFT_464241 [Rhypophila decipiens]|uniref:Uncharacterized protein n=1 Tax=Rhypophila decipiens TaxID=261697 RepID=A0AAN7B561_9PEZI|nr:hypothetical protein QBC37DRAFT_464241 [Rhypophila decipiens]